MLMVIRLVQIVRLITTEEIRTIIIAHRQVTTIQLIMIIGEIINLQR